MWHFGSQTTAMTHFGSDKSWNGEGYDDFAMNTRPKTVDAGIIKTNKTQIYLINNDGSNWETFVDGTPQLSGESGGINLATTPTIGYMQANSKQHFDGQIAEVIILNRTISTEERVRIHNYLSNKWNLTSSVDSDGDGFRDAVEKGKGTSSTDASDKPNDLPSILSQAKLWLDSANTDGEGNISLSDGDPVSDWMDLSGSNHHLSQSNSSLNPILISNVQNNNDVVKFNNSLLSMSSFNDWPTNMISVFIVQKSSIKAQSTMAIANPNGNRFFNLHIPWSSSLIYWDYGRMGSSYGRLYESITSAGTSFSSNNHYIYEFSYGDSSSQNVSGNNNTYMEIKKNGIVLDYGSRSVTIPSDINSPGAGYVLNIGDDDSSSDRSFEGNIAEILIFDKDLSSEESIKVNAYLAEKWGLNIDSDGDGINDVFDTDPTDPN